jgi:hypothetical protein
MSEIKQEQLEMDFSAQRGGESYVNAESPKETEAEVVAQVTISVLSNGQLDVSIPEGSRELQAAEIEGITRQVYDQLRDLRVAQTALEIFKARLS